MSPNVWAPGTRLSKGEAYLVKAPERTVSLFNAWGIGSIHRDSETDLTGFIIFLLLLWLGLAVLGALLEGLFWLTVVGLVLLVATGIYGWAKRKVSSNVND